MPDPAEFLEAALDAAETAANAATPGPWHVAHDFYGPEVQSKIDGTCIADERDHDHHASCNTGEPLVKADCVHIAANDPAHVLRMVAAHREMLELHKPTTFRSMAGSYVSCGHCMDGYQEHLDWPCPTVEILSGAYGWTPETS